MGRGRAVSFRVRRDQSGTVVPMAFFFGYLSGHSALVPQCHPKYVLVVFGGSRVKFELVFANLRQAKDLCECTQFFFLL